ncbi:hypothetical protein ACI2OX_05005 [Bacillus sp. N9]
MAAQSLIETIEKLLTLHELLLETATEKQKRLNRTIHNNLAKFYEKNKSM